MNILRGQEQVSQKRAMPVNEANLSSTTATSASATVQLYYYNSGVRTSDAGQAAGTVVDATFVHKNILNVLGTNVATKNDTSLAYTCLALTTELEISAVPGIATLMEALDNQPIATRAAQVGALLNNGEFVIDYRRGLLIGKKATTASTMTSVTYTYSAGGGGTGTTANQVQGNSAAGATDSGNPVKTGGVYNTTAPTLTNGQRGDTQMDQNANTFMRETYVDQFVDNTNAVGQMVIKPLSVSTYSPTLFTNFGANTTLNIKATSGNVFSFYVTNTNAAVRYFQLHNTATTPAGGAVPLRTYTLPALTGVLIIGTDVLTTAGVNFSTGIAYATSTTAGTYTAATAGDHYVEVNFK